MLIYVAIIKRPFLSHSCPPNFIHPLHMGQFPQDGKNDQNVAFFKKKIGALLELFVVDDIADDGDDDL